MIKIDLGVPKTYIQSRKFRKRTILYALLCVSCVTLTCIVVLQTSLDDFITTGYEASSHEEDMIIFGIPSKFSWSDSNGIPTNDPGVLSSLITTITRHLEETEGEARLAVSWPKRRTGPSVQDSYLQEVEKWVYEVPGEKFNGRISDDVLKKRLKRIRRNMNETWVRYKECAYGSDNLHPDSCHGSNWFGFGLTIVDSIDTLYLMGLREEVREATEFCSELSFESGSNNANVFEVTIRVLGSFLAMFGLTGDTLFYRRAKELGDILVKSGAFDTKTGVPMSDIDFPTGKAHFPVCGGCARVSSLSEATTIQLELNELTRISNTSTYKEKGDRALNTILDNLPNNRLPRIYVDVDTGQTTGMLTLGARGDSYYEYLLKQAIQTKDKRLLEEYLLVMESIKVNLLKSSSERLTFVAEMSPVMTSIDKMDHLVCFLPGTLALGTLYGAPPWHLVLAEDLIRTCMAMYHTATGLAPEIVKFDSRKGLYISDLDEFSLLRPETVESLFVLWRVTKKTRYRNWAWEIYSALERSAKHSEYGFSSLSGIDSSYGSPSTRRDSLESFFLAETMKYIYLINLPDDILPLSQYVFNTEAHPLPLKDFHWFKGELNKTFNKTHKENHISSDTSSSDIKG